MVGIGTNGKSQWGHNNFDVIFKSKTICILGPVQVLQLSTFHFSMSQKTIQKESVKKTKSLTYPNTIPNFFFKFGYVQDFFYVPKTIRGKQTNTLNYPNSIRYFGDLAKFSRILHENKKFYHLCFFCKNLAMFNSVL